MNIKAGFVLPILCGLAASSPSLAEDMAEAGAARHDLIWRHTTRGTFEVMDGELLGVARTQAILEACELDGLSDAIEPSKDLVMDKVFQYTSKSAEAHSVGLELLASIKSSMLYFKIGYRDAARLALDTVDAPTKSGLCKSATNKANELLATKDK